MNDERKQNIKNKISLVLPQPEELDTENYQAILDMVLDKVVTDVAVYINYPIKEIPEELDSTIISLAIQFIDTHNFLKPVEDRSNVSSLSEGDASISFALPSEVYKTLQDSNVITENYFYILNSFRRVVF